MSSLNSSAQAMNDDSKQEGSNVTPLRQGRRKAFKTLESVLTRVMSGLGLEQRLKEHALIDLWPVIAGEPWDRKSRALFLDHEQNLVVSVADASTGQELSLLKPQLIKKINTAGKSLGVSVRGMRLDLKHFHAKPPGEFELAAMNKKLPEPTAEELESIELCPEDRKQIERMLVELRSAEGEVSRSPVSAQRVVALFEKELKLRQWRREHDYPICASCGIPAAMLLEGEGICLVCHYGRGSSTGDWEKPLD